MHQSRQWYTEWEIPPNDHILYIFSISKFAGFSKDPLAKFQISVICLEFLWYFLNFCKNQRYGIFDTCHAFSWQFCSVVLIPQAVVLIPQKNLQQKWEIFCSHYYFHQLLWRFLSVVLIPEAVVLIPRNKIFLKVHDKC